MFDSAGKSDWPVPIGRAWMPTAIVAIDLTGGQCELVAWDKLGHPVLWMGTSGRTTPTTPSILALGSFTLSVTGAGTANAQTSLQGTLSASQTSLLAEQAYRYQWDLFDAATAPHPLLEGNLTASGRPLP